MTLKSIILVCAAALLALPGYGQTFGTVTGVVTDSSGSVIVGATITLTNPQTNVARTTSSNESGNYNLPNIAPGTYNARVELEGFQTAVRTGILIQVQQTVRANFQLSPGAVATEVTVTGAETLLNTENATVGTVIEEKSIIDLPINGRSFVSLISLSPNVTTGQNSVQGIASARSGGERAAVSVSIAGMRREYTYYSMDGISNTDVDWNTYAFLPSIDALQEFKVQSGVYSAEFGRETAHVNISTKSGTNEYHGTLFEFLRNNALDARPFAFTSNVPEKAPFRWNQFGFWLGGPVQIPGLFDGRNRLFFSSNYERFMLRAQLQGTYSLPSAAMHSGNFSEVLPGRVVRDPLNNDQPFAGNIIPTTRLHPVSVGLLEFLPQPNIPSNGLVNNHLALLNNTTDKDQFSQRIDFVESSNSTWFGRYSWQNDEVFSAGLKLNGTQVNTRAYQIAISNTRILSPTLVNEFRAGYLGYHNSNTTELAFKRSINRELGVKIYYEPEPIAWGIPSVTLQGFTAPPGSSGLLGDNIQAPWVADDHTFQFIDNVSWTRGNHSIKFGAEVRRDRYNEIGNQAPRGTYNFRDDATGYSMGDYMLGYIFATSGVGSLAQAALRATSQYYYITDSWKVLPNLTIEAGIRYEFTPPYDSKGNNIASVIVPEFIKVPTPGAQQPYMARDCAAYGENEFYIKEIPIVRLSKQMTPTCTSEFGRTTLVRDDRNDFAPRLGIAWSPTENWTVRAGAGVFYAQDRTNSYFDMARNIAGRSSDNANINTHDLTWERPNVIQTGGNPCEVQSPPFICVTTPLGFAIPPDRRTPYMYQFMTNVQRQLTSSTALEVGYLGVFGHKLQGQTLPGMAVPGPEPIVQRNPYPAFSTVDIIYGNGRSNYHSATLKLNRRLSSGVALLLSYTYSKSLDHGSGITPNSGYHPNQPQNGWCRLCEYGYSDFDTRHRMVISSLYELPFGRGKRFVNDGIASHIIGGWQLNNILSFSTGFPLTIRVGLNRANVHYGIQRPDVVAGTPWKLDNPTPGEWFDLRSMQANERFAYGNMQRNAIIGPGIAAWDFSTLKNFNFTERTYLQFRFECFNCANHPVWADPNTFMSTSQLDANRFVIPGSGIFGTVTNTRVGIDMRKLQFSLKLYF